MNYMGIDHNRQYSHITLMDENGEVLKSGRVAKWISISFFRAMAERASSCPFSPPTIVGNY